MASNRQFAANDAFAPFFEDFLRPLARSASQGIVRAPEADVLETEKDIRVLVDVPGCGPDDVELVLENNVLTVTGERQARWEVESERASVHLTERRYGRFSRAFVLPRDVDQDGIEARFENGVLTVVVPKTEKARRRRIEIRGAGAEHNIEAGAGAQ